MRFDTVWCGARLATMRADLPGLGVIEHGAVAATDGRIVFAGPEAELPGHDAARVVDCEGRWITPGLIDCHTHLVFAGDRAAEFEARLRGATYEEIARAGGGILSTVRATRAAGEDALLAMCDHLVDPALYRLAAQAGAGAGARLVVDRRLGTMLPQDGSYFEYDPMAGRLTAPLSDRQLTKFDGLAGVDRLYDNGTVRVYRMGAA